MLVQSQTREIGGRTLALKPLPAMQAFGLQPIVAPVAGRVLGAILRHFGDDSSVSLATLDLAALMAHAPAMVAELGEALGAIKPADLVALVRGLLGGATLDGMPLFPTSDDAHFNEVFAERTRDLWLCLWFAVQVNYPDFLPARAASAAPVAGVPCAVSTM